MPSLKTEVPSLAEEMIRSIGTQIPAFTHTLDEPHSLRIQEGVERALHEFVDRLSEAASTTQLSHETAEDCRRLGSNEMRAGRSLDALQAALRLGARLAWRRWVAIGSRQTIAPHLLYQLAEVLFSYIDELAVSCAEGHSQAQIRSAGEVRLRRQRLLQMLTADPPAPRQAVNELALAAGWRLPKTVQIVALSPSPQARRTGTSAPTLQEIDVLADLSGPEPLLLVPEPSTRNRTAVERYLQGRTAVFGPPMPLEHAGVSLRWARRLLALGVPGQGDSTPVTHCVDNLVPLLLLQDEVLIRALIARRLAPLAHLTPKQHERVTQTLLAWLQCGGNTIEAAQMIDVHPQTVRYRLRHIEELFGSGLRDPDVRFELEVVLRAQELLAATTKRRSRTAAQPRPPISRASRRG